MGLDIVISNSGDLKIKEVDEVFKKMENLETSVHLDSISYSLKEEKDSYSLYVSFLKDFETADYMTSWISGMVLYNLYGEQVIIDDDDDKELTMNELIYKYFDDIKEKNMNIYSLNKIFKYSSLSDVKENINKDIDNMVFEYDNDSDDKIVDYIGEQIQIAHTQKLVKDLVNSVNPKLDKTQERGR